MSAPDTNIDKQTKRHWPAILGIVVALGLGVLIGLWIAGAADVDGPQMIDSQLAPSSGTGMDLRAA